jgi:hypothetical protein
MNEELFRAAVENFAVAELPLEIEPAADEIVRSALAKNGVLLIGETHGVLENPLVFYTLMRRFGVACLGLEWLPALRPVVDRFLSSGSLTYPAIADSADGRITAGHFAALRALSQEGLLNKLVLFSPLAGYATWTDRDREMAAHLVAGIGNEPAVAMAGNLHTQLSEHRHGVPMGLHIARERPDTLDVRIDYMSGAYFNLRPKRFGWRIRSRLQPRRFILTWAESRAILTIPEAHLAAVPAG